MSKRKIIKIDENKCDGCGLCIPNCPEGAIQLIDDKARLVSDLFCDGLGACLGHCPKDAITIEEREAEEYDEKKVMGNIVKQGPNVIKAHLEHLKEHGQTAYFKEAVEFLKENGIAVPSDGKGPHSHIHGASCPGSKVIDFGKRKPSADNDIQRSISESQLRQWPVQIMLVPPSAPYFKDADILIAADCVPFAYADFHDKLLKGKILLVGCPKLDDLEIYEEKIGDIIRSNDIRSITYAHMEVPCCFGLVGVIKKAISDSGKEVPFKEAVISIKGERLK